MVATQEQTHKMLYGTGGGGRSGGMGKELRGEGGEGGGGGKRHCTNWYTYTAVYMNRVLPK